MFDNLLIVIIFILCTLIGCMLLIVIPMVKAKAKAKQLGSQEPFVSESDLESNAATCNSATCGAEDPVSDPSYNMRQVIKQSILLEEHLTQTKKRCHDCQLKHFLHIQGLVEEAMMLSGEKARTYPYMEESYTFYNNMFESWLAKPKDEKTQMHIATELRLWRKKMAEEYYLKNIASSDE